ncbi:MAG: hypothetical protein P8184_15350 [Calditrichia bacterium]
MHEVIFPLWHKAYPAKNFEFLTSLFPDIEKHFETLKQAEFPAGFPDRKQRWEEEISRMQKVMKSYKTAIDEHNKGALLNSAEALHTAYERLIKVLNPPVPEVGAFHEVLYRVYHEYMPNKNWVKLDEATAQLRERAAALKSAELPGWLADKKPDFDRAVNNLSRAVDELTRLQVNEDHRDIINNQRESFHHVFKKRIPASKDIRKLSQTDY